jgi:hypothetical protein
MLHFCNVASNYSQLSVFRKMSRKRTAQHKTILCTISLAIDISFPENWHIIILISRCLKFYILKLTRCISAPNDIITADLIKAGSRTIHSVIHKLTNAIWNKEELPQQWEESITVHFYKKGDKTD